VTLTRLGGHTAARSTREQLVHDQSEVPRGRRVRTGNRWRRWLGTATFIWSSSTHRFPYRLPPKSPYRHPAHGRGPRCGPLSAGRSVQIVGSRCWDRRGTRGTSSASIGATCPSRSLTPARGIRAGQTGVQDTVQEGARKRWRSEGPRVFRASAAVSLGDGLTAQPGQARRLLRRGRRGRAGKVDGRLPHEVTGAPGAVPQSGRLDDQEKRPDLLEDF